MWAIPLTMLILMIGLAFLQRDYFIFRQKEKKQRNFMEVSQELELLRVEFAEYKKRVDSLTLKAGFKF